MTVREARPEELATAGEVVVAAYRAIPGTGRVDGAEHRRYLARIRDARGRARSCPILVAVDERDRVLGSVTYVPGPDNPYAETEAEGEAGFRMLGVAPDARGRGVGEALVLACLDRAHAEGRSAVAITSTTDMAAAHRLYARLGFRRDPVRDFDPVPGVHLLAFRHDLSPRE